MRVGRITEKTKGHKQKEHIYLYMEREQENIVNNNKQ